MKDTLLLKNGNIVLENDIVKGDILIEEGVITSSFSGKRKYREIDCNGLFICPGFVDIHCHFRDPGFTHKEDIVTGLLSAASGGITAVCTMPNTNPICDSPDILEYQIEKSRGVNGVKLFPISAMTVGEKGEIPVNFLEMKSSGAVGFSDDGRCVQESGLAFKIAKEIKKINSVFIDHCEDYSLSSGGVVTDGVISKRFNLPPQNPMSEEIIVARDILLAENVGIKVHLQHISTKKSVDLIRWAKKRGLKVTFEVTPHHIYFSEKDIDINNSNFKMNPPLRGEEDRLALIKAIRDGVVDIIASDHAPHTKDEKEKGFMDAPFGIIGLETLVPVVMTLLYHKEGIKMNEIVRLLSLNPARIIGIERNLDEGSEANITVIDPNKKSLITESFFHSKSRNSPFIGKEFIGKAVCAIASGKISHVEI